MLADGAVAPHSSAPLQLLRAIGFMNKHGFAHLDIKRENIVLEPLDDDAITRLFLPLGQPSQASDPSAFDEISGRIQVRSSAAAATSCHTFPQVRLIDFGHATHALHLSRKIDDAKIPSLKGHCPIGYSAPEAGAFLLLRSCHCVKPMHTSSFIPIFMQTCTHIHMHVAVHM